MSYLQSIFSMLRIRTKMNIGFGILMIFLVTISIASLSSTTGVKKIVDDVVQIRIPMVIASLELLDTLDSSSAALGFYLASKDKKDKDAYIKSLTHLDELIAQIKNMPAYVNNSETQALVEHVAADIEKL